MKTKIAVTVCLVVLVVAGSYMLYGRPSRACYIEHARLGPIASYETLSMNWGDTALTVWIADTNEKRERGLSYTKCLPSGYGMLFLDPQPRTQQFWMKDMNYPIDIVWLDDNLQEIDRVVGADPASYPTIYTSPIPVRAVLELPSSL